MGFLLIGWVLMPDHFHLLIKPEPTASTSRFMQELKKGTPQRILSALSENQRVPWYGKMRARLRLLPNVQADSQFRVWQRRFYPFGVHSERKRQEKLNYIHDNPVFALMIFGTTVGRSIANIGQNEATSKTRKTKTAKKETKNTKATKMTQSASTGNLLLGSNRQASG
jgi:REP element-mobilizing transposase RayT